MTVRASHETYAISYVLESQIQSASPDGTTGWRTSHGSTGAAGPDLKCAKEVFTAAGQVGARAGIGEAFITR